MPDAEGPWKEQLGFVTGSVLAWGTLLIQLWPAIERVQTSKHIRVVPDTFVLTWPEISFRILTIPVALGTGMICGLPNTPRRTNWPSELRWFSAKKRPTHSSRYTAI